MARDGVSWLKCCAWVPDVVRVRMRKPDSGLLQFVAARRRFER